MISIEDAEKIRNAVRFYLSPFEPLLTAMVEAEGGPDAFIKAVQCSQPQVTTLEQALAIACKTIRGRVLAYQQFAPNMAAPLCGTVSVPTTDPWTAEFGPRRLTVVDAFIKFLAARWAPVGVENDPMNLNANWAGNVISLYLKRSEVS